jgi:hypothetical protein
MNKDISQTNVQDIILSDADGLHNTNIISDIDETSICYDAKYNSNFENGIFAYIPSFIEMEIFSEHLNEINDFLKNKQKESIDISNCWVSETYDKDNAWFWAKNCGYASKDMFRKYYVFGKRITL